MASAPTTTCNIKYDWYQTDLKVVVTVLAKNVTQENIKVTFSSETVLININLPNTEESNLNLNLLHSIVPDKCTYRLYPSKVEITLIKNDFIRWETLEKKEIVSSTSEIKQKVGSKNWDALAKGLIDEKEESSVETLFNKIYSDGSDDQKKAMIKSFYESNGTVLSTNWNEVRKKKVDVKPPEGVEFKPWN